MIRLNIPDMTCSHCASVVTKAVKSVDSDAEVKIDYVTRDVTVHTSTSALEVSEAIKEAGYSTRSTEHLERLPSIARATASSPRTNSKQHTTRTGALDIVIVNH